MLNARFSSSRLPIRTETDLFNVTSEECHDILPASLKLLEWGVMGTNLTHDEQMTQLQPNLSSKFMRTYRDKIGPQELRKNTSMRTTQQHPLGV